MPYELLSKDKTVFESSLRAFREQDLAKTSDVIHESWRDLRHCSWERFNQLGLPSRRQEDWKYTPIYSLYDNSIELANETPKEAVQPYLDALPLSRTQLRLVLVNGFLQTVDGELPKGVSIQRLADVMASNSNCVQDFFKRPEVFENTDAFMALNQAFFHDGVYLELAPNAEITEPIAIVVASLSESGTLIQPMILVKAHNNARAHIQLYFTGNAKASVLSNTVQFLHLASHSAIQQTVVRQEGRETKSLFAQHVYQQGQSHFEQCSVILSGPLVRQSTHIHAMGERTETHLSGLALLTGHNYAHDHIRISHDVPRGLSSQVFKGILADQSTYDFDGTIRIPKFAVQTQADQLNKNLLLSDDARVYARPQLKIDTDDVKCSHGAAIGQLNESEIFYLKSRGIPEIQAKSVLTTGFAQDILQRVPDADCRDWLTLQVTTELEAQLSLLSQKG